MKSDLTDPESYILGAVAGLAATGTVLFIGYVVVSMFLLGFGLHLPISVPLEGVLLAGIVLAGLHFAASIVMLSIAGDFVPPGEQRYWIARTRSLGTLAMFALWWRFLRPGANRGRVG